MQKASSQVLQTSPLTNNNSLKEKEKRRGLRSTEQMNPSEIKNKKKKKKQRQSFYTGDTMGEAKKAISPELAGGTERMEFEMTWATAGKERHHRL